MKDEGRRMKEPGNEKRILVSSVEKAYVHRLFSFLFFFRLHPFAFILTFGLRPSPGRLRAGTPAPLKNTGTEAGATKAGTASDVVNPRSGMNRICRGYIRDFREGRT